MPTDMHAEIKRLEPLVPTAIEEAKKVRATIERRMRRRYPDQEDVRLEVETEFAVAHHDLCVAEMIAESRAEGLDDARIAQELALVEAQGMW